MEKSKKKVSKKIETNAVFCIVNRGFTDLVMSAARKVGATGGTIMHARGTGFDTFQKFYGISVSPEKEIVFIVVKKALTDALLLAINEEAGIESPGQGIVFALPVSDYLGINLEDSFKN